MSEDERLATLRKVCTKCGQDKTWAEFPSRCRWDDGTVRRIASHCTACQREASRKRAARKRAQDPEAERERNRLIRAAMRERDEDAYQAAARAHRAAYDMRRSGKLPSHLRVLDPEAGRCWQPIGPFRDWLERELRMIADRLGEDERSASSLLCARGDIDPRRLYAWRHDNQFVPLDIVDRFACNYGEPRLLADLYPDLYVFDESEAA